MDKNSSCRISAPRGMWSNVIGSTKTVVEDWRGGLRSQILIVLRFRRRERLWENRFLGGSDCWWSSRLQVSMGDRGRKYECVKALRQFITFGSKVRLQIYVSNMINCAYSDYHLLNKCIPGPFRYVDDCCLCLMDCCFTYDAYSISTLYLLVAYKCYRFLQCLHCW